MREGTTWSYFLTDNLGSVVGVTDASGSLVSDSRYLPFGETRTDVGTITQTPVKLGQADFGYTFQRSIADTGLMDYKARMYDPTLGRFVQPDSLVPSAGSSQAYNRYAYTNNNPVNSTDPSGHCPLCVTAAVGAIVGFSVDILIQTVPQMLNGVSPTELNINWAEAGGAAVAGLIAGATLGVGTLVAAGATTGTAITTMAIAGGVGNAFGSQVGALTSGVLTNGFTQKGVITAHEKYGFGDMDKISTDFVLGGIASSFTEGMTQINASNNVPKVIQPEYSLAPMGGSVITYVSKPDLTMLGHPSTGPSFNNILRPVTIYTGLTTLSNYTEKYFTSMVSDWILRKKTWNIK